MKYSGNIDLLKLKGARKSIVGGQKCIVIPVEENPTIYVGEKGAYLNIRVVESANNNYGHSHFIASSIDNKQTRERLGQDKVKELTPIIGNLKELTYGQPGGDSSAYTQEQEQTATGDDFPF